MGYGGAASVALVGAMREVDVQTQMLVKQALVEIGRPSIPALIAALEDERLRTSATSVLSRFGAWSVAPLVEALHSENPGVVGAAATTLRLIGEPVIKALHDAMAGFDATRRYSVVEILASIRHPQSVVALIDALRDPDHEVAIRAINALAMLGDARAVEPLLEAMSHPEMLVATRAVTAVGRLTDERALEGLVAQLLDERELVRTIVIRTLGLRYDKRVVPFLVPLLDNEVRNVRDAARLALHQLEYEFGETGTGTETDNGA